jgi:tRNA A37 threonylcarbamoyladenosine modification protein TsaB
MNIQIIIENKVVTVNLLEKKTLIDAVVISEEHRLSEDLLPTIENLLKKNKLETQNIAKMTLQSDMGDNFTTHRIASAVTNAFNWANKLDKKA